MTANRSGRPRSQAANAAVLRAATELLRQGGLPAVTIDAVSARSGVSKPTIYRRWPNRTAVAIEAFAAQMAHEVPIADSGDARRDLVEQTRRVAAFYASDAGKVLTQLLGASTSDPDAAKRLRDHFFAGRRENTARIWERAVARGEARLDVSATDAIDVLFSPIVFRLLVGHAPADPDTIGALAECAVDALLLRPEPPPTPSPPRSKRKDRR